MCVIIWCVCHILLLCVIMDFTRWCPQLWNTPLGYQYKNMCTVRVSRYTPTSAMIIAKKSGSNGSILTVCLKMQLSNDSSKFFYLTFWFVILYIYQLFLHTYGQAYLLNIGVQVPGKLIKILEVPGIFWSETTKYLDSYEVYKTSSAWFLIPTIFLIQLFQWF